MKKSLLLIPSLVAITATPFIGLTSCFESEEDDPTPPGPQPDPGHDYSKDYLTFTAREDGELTLDVDDTDVTQTVNLNLQYSINDRGWQNLEPNYLSDDKRNEDYVEYEINDTIRLKGNNMYWSFHDSDLDETVYSYLHFSGVGDISGNIMSLCYGSDFADKKVLPQEKASFSSIFEATDIFSEYETEYFSQIVDASNLILPTSLTNSCFEYMFCKCKYLESAPVLAANVLTYSCYNNMFSGCESLKVAPELKSTELADYCYKEMFSGCISLVQPPSTLPAQTLRESCYSLMFNGCKNLTTPPKLNAINLDNYCCEYMFSGCTRLATAPNLKAIKLKPECYSNMFNGCSSLTKIPDLPATELANQCYYYMFNGCTSLEVNEDYFLNNFFNKENIIYADGWAWAMFAHLNINKPFTLPDSKTYDLKPYCFSGLNSGTNIVNVPSDYLPWTTLAEGCYSRMFDMCGSLIQPPQLLATELKRKCYLSMFFECYSLDVDETVGNDFFYYPQTASEVEDATKHMFSDTKHFDYVRGTPQPGHTYYWHE